MTDTKKEMPQLYSEQDASGKKLIQDILLCAVVCGEPFFEEMKNLLELGEKLKMKEALKKWTLKTHTKTHTVT